MPICEADPWRAQYFAAIPCPPEVRIPTEDADAWVWYPQHKWVYDKLRVAESQGLPCGPHGLDPPGYPVFSKPIINLRGMGTGSRMLADAGDYRQHLAPGHMWMAFLDGEHVSSDAAVVGGAARWWRHATGRPAGGGTFDYWTVHAGRRQPIEDYCGAWLGRHLAGYTGMVNFETIGSRIIEVHLRFADQWPDLNGRGWVEALIRLYSEGRWEFADRDRRDGFSVALFGIHGPHYRHPPRALQAEALATPGVTSLQITFHEDRPPQWHAMPPGGFRLAIVNCVDLAAGFAARERLAIAWWAKEALLPLRAAPAAAP